jgi:hypothetical protein
MYFGLRLKMLRKKVTIDAIADLLESHRNTVSSKLNGHGDFKVSELIKIKNAFFPDSTIDELAKDEAA